MKQLWKAVIAHFLALVLVGLIGGNFRSGQCAPTCGLECKHDSSEEGSKSNPIRSPRKLLNNLIFRKRKSLHNQETLDKLPELDQQMLDRAKRTWRHLYVEPSSPFWNAIVDAFPARTRSSAQSFATTFAMLLLPVDEQDANKLFEAALAAALLPTDQVSTVSKEANELRQLIIPAWITLLHRSGCLTYHIVSNFDHAKAQQIIAHQANQYWVATMLAIRMNEKCHLRSVPNAFT